MARGMQGTQRALSIVLGRRVPAAAAAADAKAGARKAQLCLTCHKPGDAMSLAPLLEAQPAKYLVQTLMDYKSGKRADPTYLMKTNVASLSVRDMRDIAGYFASRPPILGAHATDPAKVALGEQRLAGMNCTSCHGPSFAGSDAGPRLAGQLPRYFVRQMEAFAENRRSHPPTEPPMGRIADVEAVAHFLAAAK
jgi:cytochrome c553